VTRTEKWLVAFVCVLLTGAFALGGALIWLNARHPVQLAPACDCLAPTARTP